jgi:hypothetical protein
VAVPVRGHAENGRPTEGLVYLDDSPHHVMPLAADGGLTDGRQRYRLSATPPWCGQVSFEVRARPNHCWLAHPHELGLMRRLGEPPE